MKMRLPAGLASLALVGVSLLALLGCSRDDPAYARSAGKDEVAVVDVPAAPYTPVPVSDGGTIVGTVSFSGPKPEDPAIAITRDERVCGSTPLRQISVQSNEDRLAGALVWIADIRRGRPLPLARRFELVQSRCVFAPHWQAVVAGGALNVRSEDAMVSRSVVVDARTLDTVAVLAFTTSGAVIPLDAPLRQPALLEVRSITHPWMRAWVAVLDHPYVTGSDREGSFRISDIPPGDYTLKAWHPRFGVTTGSIAVRSGGEDTLMLRFVNGATQGD